MHRNRFSIVLAAGIFFTAASPLWDWAEEVPALPLPSWGGDCRQIVLVVTDDWESTGGTLFGLRKTAGGWIVDFRKIDVSVGRNGLGWGLGLHPNGLDGPQKQEGDRRAPAGVFPLEFGFGANPLSLASFPYYLATERDIWVDDPDSVSYNQWVRVGDTKVKRDWKSAEILRRSDGLYDYAIAVEHNRNPIVPKKGSAIFIHAWQGKGKSTIGCTVMKKDTVREILQWLDKSRNPVLVQVPQAWLRRMGVPGAALKAAGFD